MKSIIIACAVYILLHLVDFAESRRNYDKTSTFVMLPLYSKAQRRTPYDLFTRFNKIEDSEDTKTMRVSECEHKLWAEESYYPEEAISRLLNNHTQYEKYFGDLIVTKVPVKSRVGTETSNMCPSKIYPISPRQSKNMKNIQKIIINQESHYQRISVEECNKGDSAKEKCVDDFRPNGTPYCRQNYIVIKLLTTDEHVTRFDFDYFCFPSGCVCSHSRKG